MGQYFYIVNLDKKEKIHPHKFNDGLKLGEQSKSLLALSLLLATGEGVKGRWCGDRIAFIGDYEDDETLLAAREATDISIDVKADLADEFRWLEW